ncbi:hypothetical protein Csa_006553 [Cucumis sativus]|uniref:Tf2-1-like SH3-like domain-containing protein n=1 Tax=Cucumis sativus TaxID=3659 RepID=A0A0A0LKH8_CUCSA|nr:hypothetical protein Csa_006553 [Cucumis sativus]
MCKKANTMSKAIVNISDRSKLKPQRLGILRKIGGNAYVLDLPSSIYTSSTFNVLNLTMYHPRDVAPTIKKFENEKFDTKSDCANSSMGNILTKDANHTELLPVAMLIREDHLPTTVVNVRIGSCL